MMIMIRKKNTNEYDIKGVNISGSFTTKIHRRGVWANIGGAKNHIGQMMLYWKSIKPNPNEDRFKTLLNTLHTYMNSEFVKMDENYSIVEVMPISDFLIEKLSQAVSVSFYFNDYQKKVIRETFLNII